MHTAHTAMRTFAVALILMTTGCFAQTDAGADNDSQSAEQTVLITGANRGIGLELARQYTAAGWQVIGTARKPETASELASLDVSVMQLDVTDQESVEKLAADLADRSIDLLINNAGILPRMRNLDEIRIEDVSLTLAVNTVGPMRVTRALLPLLRNGHSRTIVNVTSQLGSITNNTGGGFYGYRESKAALNMFTRSLSAELSSDGFICVVVHPGWVQTDMGGANATLTTEQSVTGIRDVIAGLTPSDTGTFWQYDGKPLPW